MVVSGGSKARSRRAGTEPVPVLLRSRLQLPPVPLTAGAQATELRSLPNSNILDTGQGETLKQDLNREREREEGAREGVYLESRSCYCRRDGMSGAKAKDRGWEGAQMGSRWAGARSSDGEAGPAQGLAPLVGGELLLTWHVLGPHARREVGHSRWAGTLRREGDQALGRPHTVNWTGRVGDL